VYKLDDEEPIKVQRLENQQGHYELIHTKKDNSGQFLKIVDYGDIAEIKKDPKTGIFWDVYL
jgi:hypothetical protein